jgi:hypothetical protein
MLQTYDDSSKREDLLSIVGDITPDDTPLMTMLKESSAKSTLHEWLVDYITPPTSVTMATEGAAATYADLSQPTRSTNYTGIISKTFRVTGSERAVTPGNNQDAMDYQAGKALRSWKMDAEYVAVNGAASAGVSGYPRAMAGLIGVISTLATMRNSGTSLSETEFQDMHQHSWENGGSDNSFDLVLVPFGLKRKIDGFTAGATKYVDQSDKKLTQPVAIYETSAGIARIMQHRYTRGAWLSTTVGPTFLGIKEDKFRVAYLRKPFKELLAKDGDRDNGQIVGEFTLESLSEKSSVYRHGYHING